MGAAKPSQVPFAAACEAGGVAATEMVLIGDNPRDDIAGGAEAGMRTVWVNRRAKKWPEEMATSAGTAVRPDAVLDSLSGLPELLSAWRAAPGKL